MTINAPVVLFVYSRLEKTKQTINALAKNTIAKESDLIIFSDQAKTIDKQSDVDDVREYIKGILGFRSLKIYHRAYNYGLAQSIIDGVTQVINEYDQAIVVEDDLITSIYFLEFMNAGLARYKDDERVISVHGYMYPVRSELPETFFLRGADCWGWATWGRAWKYFNSDGKSLLAELSKRGLIDAFDYEGVMGFSSMLRDQIKGLNNSWAIRWHASAFLANKLTLYPGKSLVNNIGLDGSGEHCGVSKMLDSEISNDMICVRPIEVEELSCVREEVRKFFMSNKKNKFYLRLSNVLRKIMRILMIYK